MRPTMMHPELAKRHSCSWASCIGRPFLLLGSLLLCPAMSNAHWPVAAICAAHPTCADAKPSAAATIFAAELLPGAHQLSQACAKPGSFLHILSSATGALGQKPADVRALTYGNAGCHWQSLMRPFCSIILLSLTPCLCFSSGSFEFDDVAKDPLVVVIQMI